MTVAASMDNSVLFVDDEQRVLTSMRAMFRRDYNVLVANSGQEALEIVRSRPVDVVVSDQRMPGMTGVEVLREVKTLAPRATRILLTGYADLSAIEASINEAEVFRYLMKPCGSQELKEVIALAATAASGSAAGPLPVQHVAGRADPPPAEEIELFEVGVTPPGPGARPRGPVSAARLNEPQPDPEPAPRRKRTTSAAVELLVLSTDRQLVDVLADAMHGVRRVHHAETIDQAIALLESQSIGVLVTDTAVSEKDVAGLTADLKQHVPELVTIIASERSDAQVLIRMINYGQIFRFLLKPIQVGQSRLWIESAINRHLDLARNPNPGDRHPTPTSQDGGALKDWYGAIRQRMQRLRERFRQSGGWG
jgi:DNA-binding NtrC family response regulator